jgi:Holliday junction resolvase-like predicted endonuclease/DNA-binding XRE family transcriptional regulator
MERRTVARSLRAIRRRKGWSQRRLAAQLDISQSELSRRERGSLEDCTVAEVERWGVALGAHVSVEVRVDGERPLTDERHARLQNWLVGVLRQHGWSVLVEHSFNHYGDRGRIDVLAHRPIDNALVVVEIKTRIDDVGDVLGRLDVKRRVAPILAREQQWQPKAVVPMLLILEHRTNRRRVADHAPVFTGYPMRAQPATAWLRRPRGPAPAGILLFAIPG